MELTPTQEKLIHMAYQKHGRGIRPIAGRLMKDHFDAIEGYEWFFYNGPEGDDSTHAVKARQCEN